MKSHGKPISVVIAAFVIALAAAPASAQLTKPPSQTLVINSAAQPVPVTVIEEGSPFTIAPVQVALALQGGFVPIDPSGTRYAISSVTVSNATGTASTVSFYAVAFSSLGANCRLPANAVEQTDGPVVVVGPYSTAHIAFPEPFITAAVNGPGVCLVAGGSPAQIPITWSAVGRRVP